MTSPHEFLPPPPADECRIEPGTIHLWWVPLVASPECVRTLGDTLDVHEHERSGRYRVPELSRAYIVARGLLRAALGAYLRQPPESVRLARGKHGKPFIDGADLRFNASDSGDVVLMGFVLGAELGVDIEHIRPMPDALSIARRFFSAEEYAGLLAAQETARIRAFFDGWTKKEAALKATGEGLIGQLPPVTGADATWTLFSVSGSPDYAGALAVDGPSWRTHCWRFPNANDGAEYFGAMRTRR